MPSRTPLSSDSFSPSSSTSSSVSSSFISYSAFNNLGLLPGTAATTASSANLANPGPYSAYAAASGGAGSGSMSFTNSQASSLSSSRDEHAPHARALYPSYSSSFSNSSLELHESLLMAIRERQQQQLQHMHLQPPYPPQRPIVSSDPAEALEPISTSLDHHHHQILHQLHLQQLHQQGLQELQGLSEQPTYTSHSEGVEETDLGRHDGLERQSSPQQQVVDPTSVETPFSLESRSNSGARPATSQNYDLDLDLPQYLGQPPGQSPQQPQAQERYPEVASDRQNDFQRARQSPLLLAQPITLDEQEQLQHSQIPLSFLSTSMSLPRSSALPIESRGAEPSPLGAVFSADQQHRSNINSRITTPEFQAPTLESSEEAISSVAAGVQARYPSNTQFALSQVLTSFQEAGLDRSHDESTFQDHDQQELTQSQAISNEVPLNHLLNALVPDYQESSMSSTSTPLQMATSEAFPLIQERDLSLTVEELASLPRRAYPRRRYATRDYSLGSVSTDDWFHPPEMVSSDNSTPSATQSATASDNGISLATRGSYEDFSTAPGPSHSRNFDELRNADQTPLERGNQSERFEQIVDFDPLERPASSISQRAINVSIDTLTPVMPQTLRPTGLQRPPPISTISDQPLTDTDSALISNSDNVDSPATVVAGAAPSQDRLGLLGPLLSSSTQPSRPPASSYSDSSTDPFWSAGSNSSSRQRFDSSILSMASRIRQARLVRLLRLMSTRDPLSWSSHLSSAPMADTTSMVNNTSGSRRTSRTGSLGEGTLLDQEAETELQETNESGRTSFGSQGTGIYPFTAALSRAASSQPHHTATPYPVFAEILDCNGNPIETSSDYCASSTSSILSHGNMDDSEEREEYQRATSSSDQQQGESRIGREWLRRSQGFFCGEGRSRVLSTGTVFEGLDHISERDLLLNDTYRHHSLKASWATNPDGESWSDVDTDDPQRKKEDGPDQDDKDLESASSNRRGNVTLGFLQQPTNRETLGAGIEGNNGLYYIYGNVRNRYGPDSARRRRIMTEMSDLLRREREWEQEIEHYDREASALSWRHNTAASTTSSSTSTRLGRESGPNGVLNGPRTGPGPSWSSNTPVSSETHRRSVSDLEHVLSVDLPPSLNLQHSDFGRRFVTQESGALDGQAMALAQTREIHDYEQGGSQYHSHQQVSSNLLSERQNLPVDSDFHDQSVLPEQSQQPQLVQRFQSGAGGRSQYQRPIPMERQPAAAMMNRAPPTFPDPPQANEPIAHQIRRVHTSHMFNLQRRWELQQQQLQRLRQTRLRLNQHQNRTAQEGHQEALEGDRPMASTAASATPVSNPLMPIQAMSGSAGVNLSGGGSVSTLSDHSFTLQGSLSPTVLMGSAGQSQIGSSNERRSAVQPVPNILLTIPPPSRQQPQNHPYQSLIPTSATSVVATVPQSSSHRASFRTSHDGNGFEHFNLSSRTGPGRMGSVGIDSSAQPRADTGMEVIQSNENEQGHRPHPGLAHPSAPLPPLSAALSAAPALPGVSTASSLNMALRGGAGSEAESTAGGGLLTLNPVATTETSSAYTQGLLGSFSDMSLAPPSVGATPRTNTFSTSQPPNAPQSTMAAVITEDFEEDGNMQGVTLTDTIMPSEATSLTATMTTTTTTTTATTATTTAAATTGMPISIASVVSTASVTATTVSSNNGRVRTSFRSRQPAGSGSLYIDYEGGTLRPSERWRRGVRAQVGR